MLDALDPVLHGRSVFSQHVEARPVGYDFDLHILALAVVIFGKVRDIIENKIHKCGIVLIDLDGNPVRLGIFRGVGACRKDGTGNEHDDRRCKLC